MHLGIFSSNVEYGARPDALAGACEERGFESFWVGGAHAHPGEPPDPVSRWRSAAQALLPLLDRI